MLKKIPDSLIIVTFILLIITALTWIIPAGEFAREEINGRMVVVAGSYHHIENNPQGVWSFLQAPLKGFADAAKVIAFVLLVGGAFALVTATGAIDAALFSLLGFARRNPKSKLAILALLMLVFSVCGCTFGMSEESLVFILITIPLARSLGYDTIVGVAIPFVASGAGGAAAAFNPFTVGVAQGIAEIDLFSGWEFRILIWAVITVITVLFVLAYANRIDKDKTKSVMYNIADRSQLGEVKELPFDGKRKVVVMLFTISLGAIMYGAASDLGWYIPEICAIFLAMGILSALVCRLKMQDVVDAFVSGAKAMMAAALIIAVARGVLIISSEGKIIDTILFTLASLVEGLPKVVSVQVMFFVQGIINFFVPSGSGQAAITMPVMTPLGDLIGISRQTTVLAFQLAAGYFDLIIPTSAVTMGVLSIAGIPFNIWLKWMGKLLVMLVIVSMFFLALPVVGFDWK